VIPCARSVLRGSPDHPYRTDPTCAPAGAGLLKASTAAARLGSCSWTCDDVGGVATLHASEERYIHGKSLEDALALCLEWLIAKGTPGDWG